MNVCAITLTESLLSVTVLFVNNIWLIFLPISILIEKKTSLFNLQRETYFSDNVIYKNN